MLIDATTVKQLRDKTGAGMMDCKNALTESNGDLDAAVDFLRKSGAAKVCYEHCAFIKCFYTSRWLIQ